VKEILIDFLYLELKEEIEYIVLKRGVNLLGFNISRKPFLNKQTIKTTVLIIKPANKLVKNIKKKNRKTIAGNTEIAKIIYELIPVLRGWPNYLRISYHSQQTFLTVGHSVWQMMKWVAIKHPNQPINDAVSKYNEKKSIQTQMSVRN